MTASTHFPDPSCLVKVGGDGYVRQYTSCCTSKIKLCLTHRGAFGSRGPVSIGSHRWCTTFRNRMGLSCNVVCQQCETTVSKSSQCGFSLGAKPTLLVNMESHNWNHNLNNTKLFKQHMHCFILPNLIRLQP